MQACVGLCLLDLRYAQHNVAPLCALTDQE